MSCTAAEKTHGVFVPSSSAFGRRVARRGHRPPLLPSVASECVGCRVACNSQLISDISSPNFLHGLS
eukprot:3146167-Prymnesium_polylepis.2